MPVINVTKRSGDKHQINANSGTTLMENLRDNDMEIEAICGGCCSCATCHIFIEDNWNEKLPSRQDDEQELVEETNSYRDEESRLSCQIVITDDLDGLVVTIAPED